MGWACGGSSSVAAGNSSAKMSGIPPEFHDHLSRRRQLLWDAREKASNIAKICMSLLEFEASRDGIFRNPREALEGDARIRGDSRAWQKTYLNVVARLEVTYQSFTNAEQEWKLAQSTLEAASTGLYSATNELSIASLKAKSASGDLQSTILSVRACTHEVGVALSSFIRASRGHTALTTETGAMLKEVLATTGDLHDVHSLGKEAATLHRSLVDDLSKANAILIPLDSTLSKDNALIAEAMTRESEANIEVSSIHGQAIYQSYGAKIGESYENLRPLVPSIASSVKGLYPMLTRLAQIASEQSEVQSDAASPPTQTHTRITRGKNAYALSVLKSMEMKIDGRNVTNNREVSITEQVGYLIKQATSVDNLCNMYEGWTPWI